MPRVRYKAGDLVQFAVHEDVFVGTVRLQRGAIGANGRTYVAVREADYDRYGDALDTWYRVRDQIITDIKDQRMNVRDDWWGYASPDEWAADIETADAQMTPIPCRVRDNLTQEEGIYVFAVHNRALTLAPVPATSNGDR
jgi:hypothetical protein